MQDGTYRGLVPGLMVVDERSRAALVRGIAQSRAASVHSEGTTVVDVATTDRETAETVSSGRKRRDALFTIGEWNVVRPPTDS